MIEVKNLKKVYKMKKGLRVSALDGVSLRFPDKGMVFILGKSGSGKSTLLNVIGGLDSFDSGEIIIKGKSSVDFKQTHFDSYRNTYIGFIFQEYNILEELTVGANIALAIELQGRTATNEEINSILKEVDLEGYGTRKPNELSGGQKQRVAIARALVKKPEIIMADEPTGALDSATGKQVFDTLKALSRDKLVVIVSHDREFSEQYADRIIELADGVVISDVEKSSEGAAIEENAPEEEEAINFENGEIRISAGYMLTEEDRLLINKYLAEGEGAVIKKKEGKKHRRVSSSEFVPTDESKIPARSGNDFKLIKSRLSMKNAFKLGSSGLKHKKFRLVFTIFLSLISFTLFGLADTIAAYDSVSTATTSISDTGVSYASFMKQVKRYYDDGDNDFYWIDYGTYLSPDDVKRIETETGIDVIGVYNKNLSLSFASALGEGDDKDNNNYEIIYGRSLSGLASVDSKTLSELGFTLHGKLPEKENEIVISSFVYDYFEIMGYRNRETGKTEEIKKFEDICGKKISIGLSYNEKDEYIISGVVDLGLDYSRYLELADPNAQNSMNPLTYMSLISELEAMRDYSYATLLFVNESLIDGLIEQTKGSAETVDGHMQLLLVKDHTLEYLWEDVNMISNIYVPSVNYLENVKNITWFDENHNGELADNEIIIPISMLVNLIVPDSYNEKLHESGTLVGFERELYDKSQNGQSNLYINNLNDIINSVTRVAAYKYAAENRQDAVTHYKNWEKKYYGQIMHDSKFYNSSEEFLTEFAYAFESNNISFTGSNSLVDNYIDELISKYGIEDQFISKEIAESLVAEIGKGGDHYVSYNASQIRSKQTFRYSYADIIARKYAVRYYDDAENFYKYMNKTGNYPTGRDVTISEVVDYYVNNYLNIHFYIDETIKDKVDAYKSVAAEKYDEYLVKELIRVYEASEHNGTLVLEWYSNIGGNGLTEPLDIVGVHSSEDNKFNDMYGSENFIVLNNNNLNKILGANIGGIYSFAIGNMPSTINGIYKTVDFSYGVFDDTVKYSLKNNVTEQLSMVDELLMVLGQVFLYVGLGFALFASLMLSNFIGTSIAHKKHDIGILRAIGSRSSDVFKIFFAESFIIAMINFVLSLAGTFSVTMVINNVLRDDAGLLITFLNFGVRQIAVLLGISLIVALIATFLPVKKIASMKPIDAIRSLR